MTRSMQTGRVSKLPNIRNVVAAVWVAISCGACGALIPAVKVDAPPSATEAELNKGTANCTQPTSTSGGTAAPSTNCKSTNTSTKK